MIAKKNKGKSDFFWSYYLLYKLKFNLYNNIYTSILIAKFTEMHICCY